MPPAVVPAAKVSAPEWADAVLDYFAFLNVPRSPWQEPERLKAIFLQQSLLLHPDKISSLDAQAQSEASARYATLNEACRCLTDPKTRLRHLFDLEGPGKTQDVQDIPAGLMELLGRVGESCREADLFLREKNRATSPLLQVKLFAQGQQCAEKLNALTRAVDEQRQALMNELQSMDKIWLEAPALDSIERVAALPLMRLEQLYRSFSFLSRWAAQLQERVAQISF